MDKVGLFILAAGKGTRMGKIGKVFPKPLWPIFEKRICDYYIEFFKRKFKSDVFINSHHLHEILKDHLDFNEVEVLHETELLGTGGCVHNLLNHPKIHRNEFLVIVNSDVLIDIESIDFDKIIKDMKSNNYLGVMFNTNVDNNSYSKIIVEDEIVREIDRDHKSSSFLTFSGVSIVNLKLLNHVEGISNFFDSVLNYKNGLVKSVTVNNYLDFGTFELYKSSLYKVLSDDIYKSYKDFFVDKSKINDVGGYNCIGNGLNFSTNSSLKLLNSICLDFESKETSFENSIIYKDIVLDII